MKNSDFDLKIALIYCSEKYAKLREIPAPNCDRLGDLPFVKNDLLTARESAEMMGVKRENVYEFIDANYDHLFECHKNLETLIDVKTRLLSDKTKLGGFGNPRVMGGIEWSRLRPFAMANDYNTDILSVSSA